MIKNTIYKGSILITKIIAQLIQNLNIGSGTNLPGRIARKISPGILSFLVNQTKKEIIVITGTNGKTTTSGFIASILENANRRIAHNRKGANMLSGLTTAIIQESSINATLDTDHCLLEVDEAYFFRAVDEFNPDLLLITNLFRDQLDRYGELDTTAKKIRAAIEKTIKIKPLKVIMNADDPIVASLINDIELPVDAQFDKNIIEKIYFGFEKINFPLAEDSINQDKDIESPHEIATCKCGLKYNYSQIFYGHLGHYNCSCGKTRPKPKVCAIANMDIDSSSLLVFSQNEKFKVNIKMPGLYNTYNALAAITMGLELGISPKNIKNGLENYNTIFGRTEQLILNGKPVLIQLIKNPIGATEVLKT